jgi:hypothetical protein
MFDISVMSEYPSHIWFLCGYAGSGKDTTAQLLANQLGSTGVQISSFAGAVKDEVAIMYGFERSHLDTTEGKNQMEHLVDGRTCSVRDLIIDHAEGEKVATGDSAVWARRVSPLPNIRHWILSDWRFPEEYNAIRQRFPESSLNTIRVERPNIQSLSTYTEHALDRVRTNSVLENSGSLLFLCNQIKHILEALFPT